MRYDSYEYDYHNLADNSYFIEEDIDDSFVYNEDDSDSWDNYYHNIANEIDDT